jgi:RimJ/RimL family protein N-acetyltransferase
MSLFQPSIPSADSTPKVNLVIYTEDLHLSYLQKWMADPALMHGWGGRPMDADKVASWAQDDNSVIIILYDNSEAPIGFVCLYGFNPLTQTIKRGTLIYHEHQGKGYGQAAILATNAYARDKLGIKRIELYVYEDNTRSLHITEKLGYIYNYFDEAKRNHYFYMDL